MDTQGTEGASPPASPSAMGTHARAGTTAREEPDGVRGVLDPATGVDSPSTVGEFGSDDAPRPRKAKAHHPLTAHD